MPVTVVYVFMFKVDQRAVQTVLFRVAARAGRVEILHQYQLADHPVIYSIQKENISKVSVSGLKASYCRNFRKSFCFNNILSCNRRNEKIYENL